MTNSSLGQTVTCDSQELHRPSIRDPKIHFPNHTILRNWLTGMQQWKCLSEQSASQHLLKGNSNRTLKAVLPEAGSTNSVQKYTSRQLRGPREILFISAPTYQKTKTKEQTKTKQQQKKHQNQNHAHMSSNLENRKFLSWGFSLFISETLQTSYWEPK